jgi:hypothetical protein
MSTSRRPAPPDADALLPRPAQGQRYADRQGQQWRVQSVLPLGGADSPYFALRLRLAGSGASLVLSCQEFWAMARQQGLRPA